MTNDSRFRVVLRRDTSAGWIDTTLYCEAATATEARRKVVSNHMKPSLSRVVSCTAIGDATGDQPEVFALATVPPVTA